MHTTSCKLNIFIQRNTFIWRVTEIRHKYFVLSGKYSILHILPLINSTENVFVNKTDIKITYIKIFYQLNKCYTKNDNNTIFLVLVTYRMGEQSPYTRQCATQLDHLHTSWLHVQQIRTCTLTMNTKAVGFQCPLWHMSEHLRRNGAKGVFHSSPSVVWRRSFTLPFILPTRNCPGC